MLSRVQVLIAQTLIFAALLVMTAHLSLRVLQKHPEVKERRWLRRLPLVLPPASVATAWREGAPKRAVLWCCLAGVYAILRWA